MTTNRKTELEALAKRLAPVWAKVKSRYRIHSCTATWRAGPDEKRVPKKSKRIKPNPAVSVELGERPDFAEYRLAVIALAEADPCPECLALEQETRGFPVTQEESLYLWDKLAECMHKDSANVTTGRVKSLAARQAKSRSFVREIEEIMKRMKKATTRGACNIYAKKHGKSLESVLSRYRSATR